MKTNARQNFVFNMSAHPFLHSLVLKSKTRRLGSEFNPIDKHKIFIFFLANISIKNAGSWYVFNKTYFCLLNGQVSLLG